MLIKLELLGMSLRALRLLNKMTLAQVAEASGLSISHISEVERGETQPSLRTLKSLAGAYGETLQLMIWPGDGRMAEALDLTNEGR